jgi:hypothetical protein
MRQLFGVFWKLMNIDQRWNRLAKWKMEPPNRSLYFVTMVVAATVVRGCCEGGGWRCLGQR